MMYRGKWKKQETFLMRADMLVGRAKLVRCEGGSHSCSGPEQARLGE